jgi:ribonuclease HII
MPARFDPALIPPAPELAVERDLWARGYWSVGGVDEAGRGCWAGPVAAAVVVLPPDPCLESSLRGVTDSKQMAAAAREQWAPRIKASCAGWGVGFAGNDEVDALGIVPATRLAAMRALAQLAAPPGWLILDYLRLPQVDLPQTALVKGDARCLSIACASVLAKTARDALMRDLDGQYPGYGFARHKGYGTAAHRQALERLGACPIHRASFAPVKKMRA